MLYIIGSGPAGISCAHALLKRGLSVTMLDAGVELEPERLALVRQLRYTRPSDWDVASLDLLKQTSCDTRGISLKYVYGSDFPYRQVDPSIVIQRRDVDMSASFAKGGFSNVWGATVLPYTANDILDWPISITDLEQHYASVFSFLPLAATEDELASLFPLYTNAYHPLRPSKQAASLLEDLQRYKTTLNARGFHFGASRLAVQPHPTEDGPGCVYCGLCMYGCPYGAIYTTSSTFPELERAADFRYLQGIIVQKLVESGDAVNIIARSRQTGEKLTFEASRVYLACGVLSTAKIILDSLEAYDSQLIVKDSQIFQLPLLKYRKTKGVTEEDLHTLAQIFVEIIDQELSNNTIHLQIYTYNDMILRVMRNILGKMYFLFNPLCNELVGRLLLILGYLHSDISSTISVKLIPGKGKSPSNLILEANHRPVTYQIIKRISGKLFRNRKYFKAIPIRPLLHVGDPGKGNHCGGTFPMRIAPAKFESDCLGRPAGFRKVHIVDASVFPSIPAAPITLSVMANAYRIASVSAEM